MRWENRQRKRSTVLTFSRILCRRQVGKRQAKSRRLKVRLLQVLRGSNLRRKDKEIMDLINPQPSLVFLTPEAKDKIHQAVLQILGKMGMQVLHDDAVTLLRNAGCPVQRNGMVRIPEALVEKAIQSAPRNIPIYDREGTLAMD
ncbi:MAG: trimethylamine methyltransferase family protein, partial [Desulfobacteraceae bacterium]